MSLPFHIFRDYCSAQTATPKSVFRPLSMARSSPQYIVHELKASQNRHQMRRKAWRRQNDLLELSSLYKQSGDLAAHGVYRKPEIGVILTGALPEK